MSTKRIIACVGAPADVAGDRAQATPMTTLTSVASQPESQRDAQRLQLRTNRSRPSRSVPSQCDGFELRRHGQVLPVERGVARRA